MARARPESPDSGARGGRAWLSAALQVSAEVRRVHVGDRELDIPFHGHIAVTARDPRNAIVTATSHDGTTLGTLDLARDPRTLYREQTRRLRSQQPL